MVRSFPIFLLFLFLCLPLSADFCPAEELVESSTDFISLEKRYQQAKFYYNELHTNNRLGHSRDNWLNGASNFRKIYLVNPKSDFAAPSLYMLGRMYTKMYRHFNTDMDLKEAFSYYRDVSELFPDNSLADDALYAIGNLYLNRKDDPKKAAVYYTRVIAEQRNGDMYAHASNKLKFLSKEYGIPLPDAMLKRTYLENLSYVLPVQYWSSNNYTRVVIKASGPVRYRERLLEKNGNRPRRLYLDFQESYIDPKYRSPIPIEDGLLQQIRTAQFTPEVVRVVLDIESISDYKIFSLPDPFRVVIDVRGESKLSTNEPGKTLPKPPALMESEEHAHVEPEQPPLQPEVNPPVEMTVLEDFKKTASNGRKNHVETAAVDLNEEQLDAEVLSLAQQLGLGVRKIVIDPGHGGKDPGASAFGLKEKTIVLEIAKKLAPILAEQTGAEVILTRDDDVFIPLEERTAIANTNEADLFISLHINAHPSPKVHGLETYYLNLSTNAEAMRVAAFENATSTHQMSDLQDILSDIMKNSKINESSRLAGFVHNSLCNGIEGVQKAKFKNLGVKQAPFYVLIGAEMPAILIEIAFITNPMDSENLSTDSFLELIAGDIVGGVQSYIHSTNASL
jgi:N-acetylmuramoyl-L-alanine amidase